MGRIRGICKVLWYRLRYGKHFCLDGLPHFESKAKIKLTKSVFRCGKGLIMKPNAYLAIMNGGVLHIGKSVSIARNTIIVCHDNIVIGDRCSIAPNVAIYDHDHRFGSDGIEPGYNTAPVVIEKNCWIGVGTVILRGTHIGEGCVIGAGCVVSGDIPSHSLVTSVRDLTIVPIVSR